MQGFIKIFLQENVIFFALLRRLQEQVGEIGIGGILLQPVGDVVLQSGGPLHHLLPLLQAAAVGEEGEATVSQALYLLSIESAATCSSKPKHLGVTGSQDKCRLLALHDADVGLGVKRQQVLTEEALVELPVGRQQFLLDKRAVRPALIALAVPVAPVLHDMAAVHQSDVVHLPEDDAAPACGSYAVVLIDALHLLRSELQPLGAITGKPLPEGAARRMAAQDVLHGQGLERLFQLIVDS